MEEVHIPYSDLVWVHKGCVYRRHISEIFFDTSPSFGEKHCWEMSFFGCHFFSKDHTSLQATGGTSPKLAVKQCRNVLVKHQNSPTHDMQWDGFYFITCAHLTKRTIPKSLGPQVTMKMKVLNPQYTGEITNPQNEGNVASHGCRYIDHERLGFVDPVYKKNGRIFPAVRGVNGFPRCFENHGVAFSGAQTIIRNYWVLFFFNS